ncbi:MAG TPA: DUF4089 domain-containing protein [Salinarimonas sp.]|jgi:hypothetical protein|nr:DUF4089 domain-containing protein [Salinarimonas sp.]
MADDRPFDPEAVVDAMAPLLGLPVGPEHRPGVILNLAVTARLAALVTDFPLDDREDPAPVFEVAP